jgi:hypothetical protein
MRAWEERRILERVRMGPESGAYDSGSGYSVGLLSSLRVFKLLKR